MKRKESTGAGKRHLQDIATVQAIPDMVFRMDGQGIFLDYKAEVKDLSIPSAAIIGRGCRDVLPPELSDRIEHYISRTLEDHSVQIFEYQLPIPERGGLRHYEAHMVVSGPNEVTVVVRDLTEKQHMTAMLLRERDLISTILESSIDGILVVDDSGSVIAYNQQFKKLSGVPDGLLERGIDEQIFESVRDLLAEPDEILQKVKWLYSNWRETSRDEIRLRDGRVFDRYSAPVIGKDEQYYGRVWSFRDVTARTVLEDELKAHRDHLGLLVAERTCAMVQEVTRRTKREEQFASLIESIVEWIWESDPQFVHTYLSPRVFDVIGYRPEELIGKSLWDIMPEDEKEKVRPGIRSICAEGREFADIQIVLLHKDGRRASIEANCKPFFDAQGSLMGYRGSARDITERRKMLDELKEREVELTVKSKNLEEANAALRVFLRQRENDREELEQSLVSNVKEMVLPYLHKMQKLNLDPRHKAYFEIMAANLDQITSPFLRNITNHNFTPREIEVANLIRDGKSTKEIAEIIGIAPSAVHSHRDNIRKKLGLNNRNVNLRSYLQTLK